MCVPLPRHRKAPLCCDDARKLLLAEPLTGVHSSRGSSASHVRDDEQIDALSGIWSNWENWIEVDRYEKIGCYGDDIG